MNPWRQPRAECSNRDSEPGTTLYRWSHTEGRAGPDEDVESSDRRRRWHEPETLTDASEAPVAPETQSTTRSDPPSSGLPFRPALAKGAPGIPVPASGVYPAPRDMNQTVIFETAPESTKTTSFPATPPPPSEAAQSMWAPGQTIGQRMQTRPPPSPRDDAPVSRHADVVRGEVLAHESAGAASDAALAPVDVRAPRAAFPEPIAVGDEVPDLLWHDPRAMSRLRVWHKDLLARQPAIAFDEKLAPSADSPQDFKACSEVLAVLTQAEIEEGPLGRLAAASRAPSGHYVAPLVTLEGTLRFTFAESDELRALLGQAELHRAGHADLGTAIDDARRLLDSADVATAQRTLGRAVNAVRTRLRSALGDSLTRRIDRDVEGTLLEQRSYKKRSFLGAEWLRAVLTRGSEQTVAYLPATLAAELPLFAAIRVRLIADVIPPQDQFEAGPLALRIAALARLLPQSIFARI